MGNKHHSHHPKLVIKNFRQFNSKTEIVLAPITMLVGPNGEGKSSILLAIRLFSLSLSYIWGSDLGCKDLIESISFDDVVSKSVSSKSSFYISYFNNGVEWIKIEYKRGHNGEVKINNFIQRINLPIRRKDDVGSEKLTSIKVFPEKFNEYDPKRINDIEDKLEEILKTLNYSSKRKGILSLFEEPVIDFKFIKTQVLNKYEEQNDFNDIVQIFSSVFFSQLYNIEPVSGTKKIIQAIFYWSIILISLNRKYYSEIVDENPILIENMKDIYDRLNIETSIWMDQIFTKFDDTRKTPPEYFEYVNNSIKNDYYDICNYLLNSNTRKLYPAEINDREKLFNYISEFEIGDRIFLNGPIQLEVGHKFYSVFIQKGELKFKLKDLSSGGKQILPIIFYLFGNSYSGENILLSQPELHLHPRLQAKIADLIVDYVYRPGLLKSSKYAEPEKTIIVETHSEHIIRKLQVLVAKKEVRNTDTSIYYINDSQAKYLPLNEKGLFTEKWPDGFFPESTALTLDLIEELTKRQN